MSSAAVFLCVVVSGCERAKETGGSLALESVEHHSGIDVVDTSGVEVEGMDPVFEPGNIPIGRDGWSVYARKGPTHDLSVVDGVASLTGDFDENQKTSACLKDRIPVRDDVRIQGAWRVKLETHDRYASVRGRFFDSSGKMMSKKHGDGTIMLEYKSSEWTQFDKYVLVPSEAVSLQLCIEFKAGTGQVSIASLSILAAGTEAGEDTVELLFQKSEVPDAEELVVITPHGTEGRVVNRRNKRRRKNELVLYSPEHGPDTRQNGAGIEVAIEQGHVSGVRDYGDKDPIAIPKDGYVLSGQGLAGAYLKRFAVGDRVRVADGEQCLEVRHAVPVLVYHKLVWEGSTDSVEAQFQGMKEAGYSAISLEQLGWWMGGLNDDLPEKPIVLTFDDGTRQHYDLLPDMMERHDLHGVLFLIVTHLDNPFDRYLEWNHAREMVDSGRFELQCHSYDAHRKVMDESGDKSGAYVSPAEGRNATEHWRWQQRDLARCRNRLFAETGQNSRYVAWPFGQYDNGLIGSAVRAGFDGTLTIHEGLNGPGTPPHLMRRISISPDMTWADIEHRIQQWRVCPVRKTRETEVAPFSDYDEHD